VKQSRAILLKISTFGLGFIHSNFSNLFYFTKCWIDAKKNTMKERDLHFDQTHGEVINIFKVSIKYPKLGVMNPSFFKLGMGF
jgi:hypothetical protein